MRLSFEAVEIVTAPFPVSLRNLRTFLAHKQEHDMSVPPNVHTQPLKNETPSLHGNRQIVEFDVPSHLRSRISKQVGEVTNAKALTIERDQEQMSSAGVQILVANLPQNYLSELEQFSKSEKSIIIFRNVADLLAPPTPTSGYVDDHLLSAQDILLAGAMHLGGMKPTAFPFENTGRIGRNVVANPDQTGMASSHGFDAELFWHQDNCGQPFRGELLTAQATPPMPEHLAFFAIRNEECVPTRLLLVDDVLQFLQKSTLSILSGPHYRIGAPDSVVTDGFEAIAIENSPILRLTNGNYEMRYDPFLVGTKDSAALLANARLALALEQASSYALDLVLGAGDIMILKNYRTLHMRVSFVPKTGQDSRWLRRFYGKISL